MKQTMETNKNDSYYMKNKETEPMEMNAEALSTKKKNERFLEALKTLSDQDPQSFSEIAPELLQRCAYYWRLRSFLFNQIEFLAFLRHDVETIWRNYSR